MFKKFDPLKDKMLQVMDDEGNVIEPGLKPGISDEDVVEAYKLMQFARTADLMAVSFQRQGRMYTYPPNLGQEAISAAAGKIMRKQDWLVPAFRELGAWISKGAKLRDIYLYWGGYEDGSLFSGAPHFLPSAVRTQERMFARRGLQQTRVHIKLLEDVHRITRDERIMSTETLSF